MGAFSREKERCSGCRLHQEHCFCSWLPKLENRTRVAVILHAVEARKSTNTGQLAAQCLTSADVFVRGRPGVRLDQDALWPQGHQPLLLFPSPDAVVLQPGLTSGPTTLIVPDGTWAQATRVPKRIARLADVTHVVLPPGPPSRYRRLRRHPREGGVSTIEAIGRALDILDGGDFAAALDRVLDELTRRILIQRGSRKMPQTLA